MNIALETSLISAGTSFVVLLLGQILWPMIKDWRTKKSDGTYLAIRVVCVLDRFVEDCASTVIDDGEENDKGENVPRVTAPGPPTYPTDINWKSIKDSLMYRLLSLPASTERAANYVKNASDDPYAPDDSPFFEARTQSYANLGLQAHDLSRELRREYKLPAVEFLAWDPISRMQDELKKIDAYNDRRAKAHAEFMKLAPLVPVPSSSEKS